MSPSKLLYCQLLDYHCLNGASNATPLHNCLYKKARHHWCRAFLRFRSNQNEP